MEKTAILKEIPNINNIKLKKIKLKMDITMLDSIIAFIYKDSVLRTRKALSNTYKLFNMLDESIYEKNENLKARIWVIKKSLEARLKEGFESNNVVKQYCKDDKTSTPLTDLIVDDIDKLKLSYDETKYLIKCIDDRVEYGYTLTLKDAYQKILNKIEDGDFKSYKSVSEDLYDIASSVINIKRNTNSLDSDMTFSLRDDYFENVVTEAVQKLKDKNRVFLTGIRRLNTILSPGYQSKRLYTYLAFPGGGKSQILLKAALDIKKYNPHIVAKDPNKTPAVLLITMENDIDETNDDSNNDEIIETEVNNITDEDTNIYDNENEELNPFKETKTIGEILGEDFDETLFSTGDKWLHIMSKEIGKLWNKVLRDNENHNENTINEIHQKLINNSLTKFEKYIYEEFIKEYDEVINLEVH